MITAFVSYSHRDETFRNELETHLSMLKREGLISVWHDRRITAGTDIDRAISTQLEEAKLVLLLVSPYFLASDYCYESEMSRALERHDAGLARVVPIIVNPCEWQRTPFGRLRATPPDGQPITKYPNVHDAYQAIAADVREVIADLGVSPSANFAEVADAESSVPVPPDSPRSSNLRIKKQFTEHDEDVFLDEVFEYVANFFETSMDELQDRNPEIQTRFRRIDANHFTAAVYRAGEKQASCRVWIGAEHARGVLYSTDDTGGDTSYNECLSVTNDGQMLSLRPMMGLLLGGTGQEQFSQPGAAEYFWAAFISPLQ